MKILKAVKNAIETNENIKPLTPELIEDFFKDMKPKYPTTWYFLKDIEIDGVIWKAGKYTIKKKGADPIFIPLSECDLNF